MALHLTPDMLEACYELLKTTPPFRGWRLPPPDDIVFKVEGYTNHYAHYEIKDGQHVISVSTEGAAQLPTLLSTIAHEMIHLYQAIHCKDPADTEHNEEFFRIANNVCRKHGFDPKLFCFC